MRALCRTENVSLAAAGPTRRIRKSLDSVPILAVSAYGADQFREQALAAGCNEYVSTPFEPATLEGIIRSLVQR